MNNNNTFLELRQATATNVYSNGDYHSNLKKAVVLNEGDQLILNKAIIDSASADSGNVVLQKDTTLGFNFNYYVLNKDTDEKYTNVTRTVEHDTNVVEGEQYILCRQHAPSAGYTIVECVRVLYRTSGNVSPGEGGFVSVIQYIDADSQKTMTVSIPMGLGGTYGSQAWSNSIQIAFRARQYGATPYSEIFKDLTKGDELKEFTTSKELRSLEVAETPATGDYYPITGTVSVTLPAGNYSPVDFAERFTRLVTIQRESQFLQDNGSSNNPLLISTSNTGSPTAVFTRVAGGSRQFYYGGSPTGGDPALGTARWIGTNQLVLEYDEGSSRFKISQSHFPIYNETNGAMQVTFISNENSTTEFKLVSAESGIAFASFFSTQDGNEVQLWDNILGFNTHSIIAIPQEFIENPTLGFKVPNYGSEFQVASQITTGNRGMDVGVIKQTTRATIVPNLSAVPALSTDITEIEPIFASRDFTTSNLTFGYFLISVEGAVQQDLITNTNIHTNIFSIISRYYQNNNYTTGNSSDAVIYQHVGAPAYLNSLRVRILNSSYVVPDDLGEDNTCYLQHIKASVPAEQKPSK